MAAKRACPLCCLVQVMQNDHNITMLYVTIKLKYKIDSINHVMSPQPCRHYRLS